MADFGERLKQVRVAAGLSQEKLGIEAGIEEASASVRMNRYERGERTPAIEIVRNIAAVLDVPVSFFFAQSDDEANLLLTYHRLPTRRKKELLKFIISG